MVHARLHIICGNCGSNKDLSYKIDLTALDDGSTDKNGKSIFKPDCYIYCKNCSTVHSIDSELPQKDS